MLNVTVAQLANVTGVQWQMLKWSSRRMIRESSDECYSGPAGEYGLDGECQRSPRSRWRMTIGTVVQLANITGVQ